MPLDLVTCPICGREQPALSRYPGYLCRDCVARAEDASGRRLVLTNTSPSGGFAARFADDGELAAEVTLTHLVYVDGVPCHADEAHLGGIVVKPLAGDEATPGNPEGDKPA